MWQSIFLTSKSRETAIETAIEHDLNCTGPSCTLSHLILPSPTYGKSHGVGCACSDLHLIKHNNHTSDSQQGDGP